MSKDWRIDIASFGLRIVLGLTLIYFGMQKLFGLFGGPGYNGTLHFMAGLNIHPLLANVSIIIESLGSLLLIFGLMTRPAALGIAANMAVATFFNLKSSGAFEALKTGDHSDVSMRIFLTCTMTAMGLACAALGGGTYSLDGRFFKSTKKK